MIVVELTTTTLVAAFAPNATVDPEMNPVPVIVTLVPPPDGPEAGFTALTVGPARNVNWSPGTVPEVPPAVVTCTSTVPAPCAGDVAVIDVAEFTVTPVAAVPPKLTVAPVRKFVPVIVTDVPPPVGPDVGTIDVTAGATALYVNWSAPEVADVPPDVVTVTSTVPVVNFAGEVAVTVVELTTLTPVAAVPPKLTVAPLMKFVPVIVTAVPPPDGPLFGLTPVTVGTPALYVNLSPATTPEVPPDVVTLTSTCPAASVAGDTAVIDVAEFTTTPVAAFAPNATVALLMKFVPVIVTDVPPVVGPDVGLIDVTAGATAL